jgi:2-haloacid dehalogenase
MPHDHRSALQMPGIRSMLTLVAEPRLVPLEAEIGDRRLSVSREVSVSRLNGIRACVFDAYGTIFDFASAAEHCPGIPEDRRAALTTLWRDKQLQYTWLRTLQGRYVDFWQVTGDALDFALESLGLLAPHLRERLMALYRTLAAFPEVSGVLQSLRQAGFVTAILSNGSPGMLNAAVAHAGLDGLFDAVLSADAVGIFKTHPKVYQYALDQLRVPASAVLFQSSNAWDAHAAADFGMRVVWCNRYGQKRERLPGTPDYEIRSLTDLPSLLLATSSHP